MNQSRLPKAAPARALPDGTETIETVVNSLFSGDRLKVPVHFEIEEGETEARTKIVQIRRGRMKELSRVIAFFRAIIERVPPARLEDIIALVADMQRMAMAQGESPQNITLTPRDLIAKWTSEAGLVLEMLQGTVDLLPGFISIFTDLTEKEGDNLEFDDAALVIIGIIGANYAFFTLRLRPIMQAVIAESLRKRKG